MTKIIDRKNLLDAATCLKNGGTVVFPTETVYGLGADALKEVTNADIAYVNGGGVRAPINVGDVTYNDIYNVFPFNNKLVVAEATGKTIRDMLEMAVMNYPAQDGSFPHVAGMTFSVDKSIPSSVKIDSDLLTAIKSFTQQSKSIVLQRFSLKEYFILEIKCSLFAI